MNEPPDTAAPPRRRIWLTVLLCVLIFAGGLAAGAGVATMWVAHRVRDAVQHPEAAPHRVAQRLQRRLDLDDAQAARIEEVLVRHHADLLDARADFLERIGPILDQVDEDVAAELPGERSVEWRREFRLFREEWVPRPDGPRRLRNR